MTTVLMLDGFLFSGQLPAQMKGQITAAPNTAVQVPYNNLLPTEANIVAAVDLLDGYLHNAAYAKPLLVYSISMGSQVACNWLKRKGATSDIAPADLSFLMLGNPERKFNGATVVAPKTWTGFYGGTGYDVGLPYKVVDFARQYDGWSDWPDRPNPNGYAILNAEEGMGSVHTDYTKVSLTDAANVTWQDGNTTFILSPTAVLPINLWSAGMLNPPPVSQHAVIPAYTSALEVQMRPIVEGCYSRPTVQPPSSPSQVVAPTGLGVPPPWLPRRQSCLGSLQPPVPMTVVTPLRGFLRLGTCTVCDKQLPLRADNLVMAVHPASWSLAHLPTPT